MRRLVPAFRAAGGRVVWIVSVYAPELAQAPHIAIGASHDEILDGTHCGRKRCCAPGSFEAGFYDDPLHLQDLVSPETSLKDLVVVKHWFSAFKDTDLVSHLSTRGIAEVFVCGLLSNMCVSATSRDAERGGFRTSVISDCLCWRRLPAHEAALQRMPGYGVALVTTDELIAESSSPAILTHSSLDISTELTNQLDTTSATAQSS